MPGRRRFATPKLLLRAYTAHQHTRERLRTLTEQAEDEQEAIDREMAELLRHFPDGLRDGETVFTSEGRADCPVICARLSPVEIFDVESWADVEERGADGENATGDDEAAEAVLDPHADVDGSLATAGVEVRDDDGDDL